MERERGRGETHRCTPWFYLESFATLAVLSSLAFIKGIQTVEQCHELRVRDIAFLVLVGVDEECLEHFLLAEKQYVPLDRKRG